MRLKRMVVGLSRTRRGLLLLGGVSALLTGVHVMFSSHRELAGEPVPARKPTRVLPVLVQLQGPAQHEPITPASKREHYFTIKQTRSEVGFVYWVLQGFGRYQSFTLFDTWTEAVEAANGRLQEAEVAAMVVSAASV